MSLKTSGKTFGKPRLATTNADSWFNMVTGLNIIGKDKSTANEVLWDRLDRETQNALFTADDLGGKIAKIIPFDGTRAGITWNVGGADDETEQEEKMAVIEFLETEFDRLRVWETFFQAWVLARVQGGSLVLMVVDDGLQLDQPLNENSIRKIDNLMVLERWDLNIYSGDLVKEINDPEFGTPEYYHWNKSLLTGDHGIVKIHSSRVIRFDGEFLPRELYIRNSYWHDSIYTRLLKPMEKYSTGMESAGRIMQDFNQAVYKIEGLTEAVAQDQEKLVVSKLLFVDQMRSSTRALVLDKEDDFDHMQSAVGGIKDIIDKIQERLTAASDIPHTRLMGESPGAALGETGKSELIDYYDTVASRQEIKLRRPITFLTEMIFAQIQATVAEPENWGFTFDPLFQQDQEAIIRTRNLQANTDQIYMQNGVIDSFEVAKSRFGSGEYSFETRLDPDRQDDKEAIDEIMREKELEMAENQQEQAGQGVDPFGPAGETENEEEESEGSEEGSEDAERQEEDE